MSSRFIQIHTLTPYAGVLLNRDDAGYAKRLTFGDATRTRVSSQCLKRHWRTFDGDGSLAEIDGYELSTRSRFSVNEFVAKPLKADGYNTDAVDKIVGELIKEVLGTAKKDSLQTGQIVVLGKVELDYMKSIARDALANDKSVKEALKEHKKSLGALAKAAGLDAALFGRMVTSDLLARGDAAIHVAHAFTVHGEQAEDDYFSAVDELLADLGEDDEETRGSGHIGTTEITSGLFYSYVVVDVPLLVSNLTGVAASDWDQADRSVAAEVVRRLIRIIATVSPGAKLGSTAPYAHARAVLVEAGDAQPRTLANAFFHSVSDRGDVAINALDALITDIQKGDRMYDDMVPERALAQMISAADPRSDIGASDDVSSISQLASWAAERVNA